MDGRGTAAGYLGGSVPGVDTDHRLFGHVPRVEHPDDALIDSGDARFKKHIKMKINIEKTPYAKLHAIWS